MYEVLRRHSATVRFQHGAPPDIIGTTHISPPQCVKPPAIPRFVPSFFTPARDLRAQIHLPCRRERLPFLHPCSLSLSLPRLSLSSTLYFSLLLSSSLFLSLASPSLPVAATAASDPPASRRLYIASGKILRRIRRAWPRSRDESIRELPPARRTAGSQSVAVNIGRPFSIYFDAPSVRAASASRADA